MPNTRELLDRDSELLGASITRRDAQADIGLLPPDLCRTVIIRAQAEATRIRAWVEKVDAELTRLRAELKTAEAAVRAEYRPVPGPVRTVGDILSGTSRLERTPSVAGQRTEKAIAREQVTVLPLRVRIAALEAEKATRHTELGHLRTIVRLAGTGSVALLNHLTAAWRARLEVGPAVFMKLPPAARELGLRVGTPTDAAGNPLPPEALDGEGKPDLGGVPVAGEPVSATLARANSQVVSDLRQPRESLADYSRRTGRTQGGAR